MRISAIAKAITLAVAALTLFAAAPARADWKRAESANFIVYSQSGDTMLRRYVRTLELYDYILRYRLNVPLDTPVARKLPIYLVGGRRGLLEVRPDAQANAAGVYFPVSEGMFAVAFADQEMDYLLHEYFHHFSFQNASAAHMPGWLIEGLAEYFMTAEVDGDEIRIGDYNRDRAAWLLNSSWLPLDVLLSTQQGELTRIGHRNTYYPVAWLLTHWFMSDEARLTQLSAYVVAVNGGADPVAAMQQATGLSLEELRTELRRYVRSPLRIVVYKFNTRPEPEITITRLPDSADDLLLLGQRLKVGVRTEQLRVETANLVRRRAARHPDDPFALLQLGHAELHFGDAEAAEPVLTRLLEMQPDNVEALQLMASRYIDLAEKRPDDRVAMMNRAQGYLGRAYQADPEQYYTLYLIARTREGAATYPNENDLLTWGLAFDRAPQLPGIRMGYGSALMSAGQFDEAVALLTPLANTPHGGAAAGWARVLLERAKAGQPPLSRDELQRAVDEASQPAEQPEPTPEEATPAEPAEAPAA